MGELPEWTTSRPEVPAAPSQDLELSSMAALTTTLVVVLVVLVVGYALSIHVIKQYEGGSCSGWAEVRALKKPGFRLMIPFVDVMRRVSLRVVTMPTNHGDELSLTFASSSNRSPATRSIQV